ncbi:MAG: rRNA maturation RNase YbeY, partial [Novipirellula sp. JB048]
VVSLETAQRIAERVGWPAEHELLLYVVHGTLHITGMEDHQDDERGQMRVAETEVMQALGIDAIVHHGADMIELDAPPSSPPSSCSSSSVPSSLPSRPLL